jgi:hypothetical protein
VPWIIIMAWLHAVRLMTLAAITTNDAARCTNDFSVRCKVLIGLLQWCVVGGYRRDVLEE